MDLAGQVIRRASPAVVPHVDALRQRWSAHGRDVVCCGRVCGAVRQTVTLGHSR